MRSKLGRAFIVSAATIALVQMGSSAAQSFDRGKHEYETHCAVCHGLSAKGDGPFVQQLKSGTVVPNLTDLSKKNNGVFPFMRVYDTIDGAEGLKAHGTEMPVWGRRYKIESEQRIYDDYPADTEPFVRARILALTEYIYRLQAK